MACLLATHDRRIPKGGFRPGQGGFPPQKCLTAGLPYRRHNSSLSPHLTLRCRYAGVCQRPGRIGHRGPSPMRGMQKPVGISRAGIYLPRGSPDPGRIWLFYFSHWHFEVQLKCTFMCLPIPRGLPGTWPLIPGRCMQIRRCVHMEEHPPPPPTPPFPIARRQ